MKKYRTKAVPPDHPLAIRHNRRDDRYAHAAVHRLVLYDAIGEGPHPCRWCGVSLEWRHPKRKHQVFVDHLDDDTLNNDLSNLVVSCNDCNRLRPKKIDEESELFIERPNGRRERAEERICEQCGETFLFALAFKKNKGWGRFCGNSCRAKHRWATGELNGDVLARR